MYDKALREKALVEQEIYLILNLCYGTIRFSSWFFKGFPYRVDDTLRRGWLDNVENSHYGTRLYLTRDSGICVVSSKGNNYGIQTSTLIFIITNVHSILAWLSLVILLTFSKTILHDGGCVCLNILHPSLLIGDIHQVSAFNISFSNSKNSNVGEMEGPLAYKECLSQ
uniref:Uncharacterized protein n=1 Tax=Glossina brevipalpis TaxID=37001 RepID=A0A1A9WLF4_9MUSC